MSDLPEWAQSMWEELGSPEISDLQSVHTGDLMERRHGLRKDDLVEIQLDARALKDGDETWVKGRLLSSGKSSIELLTTDGDHVYILDGRLTLHCLDAKTGNNLWIVNLVKKHKAKLIRWQNAAAPIIDNDLIFVCGG